MNNVMKCRYFLGILLSGALLSAARADDVRINFTGNIKSPVCTVDPASVTRMVQLGSVSTTKLSGPGELSEPVSFSLIINCPANGPVGATVLFSAAADQSDPTLIAIDSGNGSASGVAIRLEEADGTKLNLAQTSAGQTLVSGQNTLDYRARYQALVDRPLIQPGTANGTAQFTINYQ